MDLPAPDEAKKDDDETGHGHLKALLRFKLGLALPGTGAKNQGQEKWQR